MFKNLPPKHIRELRQDVKSLTRSLETLGENFKRLALRTADKPLYNIGDKVYVNWPRYDLYGTVTVTVRKYDYTNLSYYYNVMESHSGKIYKYIGETSLSNHVTTDADTR